MTGQDKNIDINSSIHHSPSSTKLQKFMITLLAQATQNIFQIWYNDNACWIISIGYPILLIIATCFGKRWNAKTARNETAELTKQFLALQQQLKKDMDTFKAQLNNSHFVFKLRFEQLYLAYRQISDFGLTLINCLQSTCPNYGTPDQRDAEAVKSRNTQTSISKLLCLHLTSMPPNLATTLNKFTDVALKWLEERSHPSTNTQENFNKMETDSKQLYIEIAIGIKEAIDDIEKIKTPSPNT